MRSFLDESVPIRVLANIVSFVCCAAVAAQPVLAEASIKGWMLHQRCYLLGDETLYVAPHALRVEWKSQGTVMLCKAPDFKLIVFNPSARRYYETSDSAAPKMVSNRLSLIVGLDSTPHNLQPAGKGTIAGVAATNLEPKVRPKHGPTCKQFWIADLMQVAPRLANAYCHYISVPAVGKIPVKVVNLDPYDQCNEFLVTKECRQVDIPASKFDLPKSYQRVTSDAGIMVNDSDVGEIFGIGEDEPKKNKKKN